MDVVSGVRQHRAMKSRAKPRATQPAFAWLGRQAHSETRKKMQQQVACIQQGVSGEQIWACEHDSVYTTGRRGVDNRKQKDLPAPLIHTERGGETTYHGPGQLMLYPLISLRNRKIGVHDYVCLLEQSCIDLLQTIAVDATRRDDLPGIWKDNKKIAAIGLRISHGIAWHGMALNVSVQSQWFAAINPCGTGLGITRLCDYVPAPPLVELAEQWYVFLSARLDAAAAKY